MNLKEYRHKKGLTQQQVEQQIGISKNSYRHIENGRRLPSVTVAKKLGELLGFDWAELYGDNKDCKQITVIRKSSGEVLAVIAGNEIIEKDDIEVIFA